MARFLLFFCFIVMCKGNQSNGLKLEQVVIFSRHNIRTPLATDLQSYTQKQWPKFYDADAELTRKGGLMENKMGDYFAEWMASKNFIKGCPNKQDVFVYANTKSRTRNTAKFFAETAFRNCNISVHHYHNINVFDPLFHPVLHNASESLIEEVINEMEYTLNETDLTPSYLELNSILDIGNSPACRQEGLCDLSKNRSRVVYEDGEEPDVIGPLTIGTKVVDTFVMSYYEGFTEENVAWGRIDNDKKWETLTRIIKQNLNVRFSHIASKNIGKPLLDYMFNIFRSGSPKFTILVGHDSNLCIILKALGFKPFEVKDQYEPYPIGGKLVFQKWSDGAKSFLKVEYLYPTFSQLRFSEQLSMENPPQSVLLELEDCKINDGGFCPWEDFLDINYD